MDVRLPSGVLIQGIPEGTSKEDIQAKAISSGMATAEDFVTESTVEESRDWKETLIEGAINMPQSTAKLAGHVYDAVTSPIETGKTVIKLLSGGLQNILGDDISNYINDAGMMIGLGDDRPDAEMASKVGEYYSNKYGSSVGVFPILGAKAPLVPRISLTLLTLGVFIS